MEAISLTYTTSTQIEIFILNYLIYRYGIPKTIIIDTGRPFKIQYVKESCHKIGLQHRFSTPY